MNLVASAAKGESVWLGFFLYSVLREFATLAEAPRRSGLRRTLPQTGGPTENQLEQHAWDGAWYRRAYFDDGAPLGSAHNTECQIDSIAQSWSVLSGAGDAARSPSRHGGVGRTPGAADRGLVQLLNPPFDKGDLNPGYIKVTCRA